MAKHAKTLHAVFEEPTRSDLPWRDIESLLKNISAKITEGKGSRIRMKLNDVKAVFHRPHPQKEASKGCVESVRRFLERAGYLP